MKVLAFTPQYLPVAGGIEMIVADLSAALRGRGVETAVVTDTIGDLPRFEIIADTRIHRLSLARPLRDSNLQDTLANIQEISRIVAVEQPDLLHIHSATQASVFYLDRIFRKHGSHPPFIVTQHGALEDSDKTQVTRRMILGADLLTAVSQAALASAIEATGRAADSRRIYNGIATDPEFPAPRAMPPRHTLLCVGRMQREKGFDLAIDALAAIRGRGLEAELVLVGHGEDGRQFEGQARALGISQYVRFLGAIERKQVRQLMAESSILLAPSRTREGFCLAAAEAAGVGTPCVVSDVGGLPETVEHAATGFVVPSEDVEALVRSIALILSDRELWSRLSARAHEHARSKFGLDRCVDSYAAAYRDVVESGKMGWKCDTK
ncbi:MAG TPA: glycosyltransferase family 4 protein [Dongiaceae bacterium]